MIIHISLRETDASRGPHINCVDCKTTDLIGPAGPPAKMEQEPGTNAFKQFDHESAYPTYQPSGAVKILNLPQVGSD